MTEIDPKDFGALEANVRNLTTEIHLLRQDMQMVQALINQSKGGLWVVVFIAGGISSAITIFIKKLFGA